MQRRRRRRHAFKLQQMVLTIFAPASVFPEVRAHFQALSKGRVSLHFFATNEIGTNVSDKERHLL